MCFLKRIFPLFVIIIFSFPHTSCEWINPDEQTPAFIKIEAINLTTTLDQGSASNNITDAWVYIDDEIIGAFELPATIPVLSSGVRKITVKPGIQLNGISSTRSVYPFYKPIEMDINLVEGNITNLGTLSTTYYAATLFPWMEDFEQGGVSMEETNDSDTSLFRTSDPTKVFEGGWSGIINLDDVKTIYEGASSLAYELPDDGSYVFLELDFKTNIEVTAGVYINKASSTTQHPLVVLNKTDEWKKIYINLTTIASRETSAIDYKIFFGAVKTDDVGSPEILLDNIKLVHF